MTAPGNDRPAGPRAAPFDAREPFARVAPGRLRLWAVALVAIGLVPVLRAPFEAWHDWPAFWSAGALAGSAALVDAAGQSAWQIAHGLPVAYFPYPPAAAWAFVPFAWLPVGAAFAVFGALMLGALVGAGWLGARVYSLSPRAGVLATLAWAPATASIVIGQNAPLGLLLALAAIAGLVAAEEGRPALGPLAAARGETAPTRRPGADGFLGSRSPARSAAAVAWRADLLAGVAAGLACYKPTFGLPLVGLLLLRRRWVALTAAFGVVGIGYLLGALAVGGDLAWPGPWLAALGTYVDLDFAANADKAVSLPGLLQHAGTPGAVALAVGALLVALALPFLARARAGEAGAVACLVGVAASPHAWGYDAALLVPMLLLLLADPDRWLPSGRWRTPSMVGLYMLGPTWLVSRQTVLSGVAVAMLLLVALWARGAGRSRAGGSGVGGSGVGTSGVGRILETAVPETGVPDTVAPDGGARPADPVNC